MQSLNLPDSKMVIYEGNKFNFNNESYFEKACNCNGSSNIGYIIIKNKSLIDKTEQTLILYDSSPCCNSCGKAWKLIHRDG